MTARTVSARVELLSVEYGSAGAAEGAAGAVEGGSAGPELSPTYTDTITDTYAAAVEGDSDSAGLKCTQEAPCLFNVEEDETEHNEQAAKQPDVVKRLQKEYAAYVAHRYTGTLDVARTSEEDYCAFIKETRWVQPYE
jgi:hypothetical protein